MCVSNGYQKKQSYLIQGRQHVVTHGMSVHGCIRWNAYPDRSKDFQNSSVSILAIAHTEIAAQRNMYCCCSDL